MVVECKDKRKCCLRSDFWGCKALSEAPEFPCRFAKPTMNAKPYDLPNHKEKPKRIRINKAY